MKHFKHPLKSSKGFTLVELLVVISIIGILSSFAVVSLNDARIKARDAKRQSDVNQVYTALQLYLDNEGGYPQCACDGGNPTQACWDGTLTTKLSTEPAKPYITPIPEDPKGSEGHVYKYCSDDGEEFIISYKLEGDDTVVEIRGF